MTMTKRLRTIGADLGEYQCPSCGADYEASSTFPWHLPDEDCRAIREPLSEVEVKKLKGWPADTVEQMHQEMHEMCVRWGVAK